MMTVWVSVLKQFFCLHIANLLNQVHGFIPAGKTWLIALNYFKASAFHRIGGNFIYKFLLVTSH